MIIADLSSFFSVFFLEARSTEVTNYSYLVEKKTIALKCIHDFKKDFL